MFRMVVDSLRQPSSVTDPFPAPPTRLRTRNVSPLGKNTARPSDRTKRGEVATLTTVLRQIQPTIVSTRARYKNTGLRASSTAQLQFCLPCSHEQCSPHPLFIFDIIILSVQPLTPKTLCVSHFLSHAPLLHSSHSSSLHLAMHSPSNYIPVLEFPKTRRTPSLLSNPSVTASKTANDNRVATTSFREYRRGFSQPRTYAPSRTAPISS